jgi:hypothetical protein
MDGLHLMIAPDTAWRIGGHDYRLAPLRLADYAEMEARLLADGRAGSSQVSLAELADWMETRAGQATTFWLALRRRHPAIGRVAAAALFQLALAERPDVPRRLADLCGAPSRGFAPGPESSGPPDPDASIPWAALFRRLGRAYGWTPSQVGELTLAQLAVYAPRRTGRRRRVALEPAAARAFARRIRAAREPADQRTIQPCPK